MLALTLSHLEDLSGLRSMGEPNIMWPICYNDANISKANSSYYKAFFCKNKKGKCASRGTGSVFAAVLVGILTFDALFLASV